MSVIVLMGVVQVPDHRDIWSRKKFLGQPDIAAIMPRNRFEKVTRCLHLVDNRECSDRDSSDWDPLFKIRPMIDQLQNQCAHGVVYSAGEHLTLDEGRKAYKGKYGAYFRIYNPQKPIKHGFQWVALNEAGTGVLLGFEIYAGQNSLERRMYLQPDCIPFRQERLTDKCITRILLTSRVVYTGKKIWMDNLYTSVPMALAAKCLELGVCGTLRRQGLLPWHEYVGEQRGSSATVHVKYFVKQTA